MGQAMWAVGAFINLMGSIFINFGTNVMKLGHNKRDLSPLPEEDRPPIRAYREWQIGIALFALGNIFNFISFGFAAQSLLAALGSVQFISNVIFAYIVLHEKVTKKILGGTGFIVVGCVLLVSFGNHDSKVLTVNDMIADFKSTPYIVYMVLLICGIASMYTTYRFGKSELRRVGHERLSEWWVRMLPISYAMFSGMLGTQSVLFCKMLSMLLRTTIQGHSQLASWFTWLIFFLFLGTAFFWVSRLNKALKQFPAIMIVPTMQISWTLFSIIGGGIYFQEYKSFTALSASMFGLGVCAVFGGVYMLTPSKRAYLRHYRDLEDKRLMLQPSSDAADLELAGATASLSLAAAHRKDNADSGRMAPPDVEMGATQRFLGSRKGPEVEPAGGYEPAKLASLRIVSSQLSPRDAVRSSATGDRWEDIVMSPLSTVDVDEADRVPASRQPASEWADGASFEHQHTLFQDLLEDFSMDLTDNYRRMLGLDGTGQLPGVSAIGMPFDCFTDDDPATRADAPPQSSVPSNSSSHVVHVAGGPGTSRRTNQSGGNAAGPASHHVCPTVSTGQLPGSQLQPGLGPPPGGVDHPGYRGTSAKAGGDFPRGQGGLLSLQLADAGVASGDGMSPSSFGQVGDGPAVRPGQKDRTGYPSDVSSPWLSPASSGGVGSPP